MSSLKFLACLTCIGLVLLSACEQKAGAPQSSPPPEPVTPANPRFKGPLDSVLEGTWEGFLERRLPLGPSAKGTPPEATDVRIRLAIEHEAVKVYLKDEGHWGEAMPGKFTIARLAVNASIVGMNSAEPESGGWVESWAILVTAIDDDTLQAEWTRVVNNIEPGSDGLTTFSMAASGVMRRVSP